MKNRYQDWLPVERLGEKIARLRTEKRLSTRDFATYGVSASTVSRVERGHDTSLRNLIGIAQGLGIDVLTLLTGVDWQEFEE